MESVERYIPPELRPVVELAGMMNPVQGILQGMGAAGRGDYGEAAMETALAAAPIVGARLAGQPARAALAELFGFSGGLGSVAPSGGSRSRRRVLDELSDEMSSGLGSPAPSDFGFRRDNPGGDWLEGKRSSAEEIMASGGSGMRSRGITGSVTGTMGMETDMFLPTDILSRLKGASGENRAAGDPKFDDLMSSVREEGFDPNQKGNRVVISVNHRGEPYLMEGNTRVAVARELGVPGVRAEVRYWNGGEDVEGAFAPDVISRVASPSFSAPPRSVSPDDLQPSEGMTRRRFLGGLGASALADSADIPVPPVVLSQMSGDDFGRGLGSFEFPAPEASQRTQITGTLPTYEKAVKILEDVAPEGRSLDYGAGRGKSSELGFDTFEPYPREDFSPTYGVSSDIPDESYERVTNFNVLNVVDPETRGEIVRDIGRILKPDGVALITTRGRDVLSAKGSPGPEEMSIVTSAGTYQKGFTRPELVDYLQGVLGDGFEVSPLRLGPAGAMVRKLAP